MEVMEARRSTSLSSIPSITSLSQWMRFISELRILYAIRLLDREKLRMSQPVAHCEVLVELFKTRTLFMERNTYRTR